ncbi:16S rRNA (guanine(527)-N(7))-methyltransferase RsmG [Lutispora thermophila]|uniref:Ribosomal RNA small subunit methyltransferase G n=1 Tax=Lutispora thermophila DSM 19022 TaxID=1122184 RepID=A0A1M6HYQ3_9FIRM|nr:16S rRNA (guanine(527)-N(7))-methyltransferase RsmG [Lutispora thermophila]SHJ27360.1 16S rRNA m(7)G-527 methyltransferase [Lutispora thermophila DSM 19022]
MNNVDMLRNGFKELDIDINEEKLSRLLEFKDILLEWNEKINLTSITDEEEIFIKHFMDSATCLSTGLIKSGDKIIDIGTGAGFPGLVLKILKEDVNMTLLDSLNKRIIYLKEATDKLALDKVELIHGRAEEYGAKKGYREEFDIAVSRAVAPLNVLLEYCMPFVKLGGYFICQKGPSYQEELQDGRKAMEILGGELDKVEEHLLPFSDIRHYIIIIKKVRNTPTKYPRKPGKPSSNPLK